MTPFDGLNNTQNTGKSKELSEDLRRRIVDLDKLGKSLRAHLQVQLKLAATCVDRPHTFWRKVFAITEWME